MPWLLKVFDSFDGPNFSKLTAHSPIIGGAWIDSLNSSDGFINIFSNAVIEAASGSGSETARNDLTIADKQFAEIHQADKYGTASGAVRVSGEGGSANGYFGTIVGDPYYSKNIYRLDSGTYTQIATASSGDYYDGVMARIEADGDTIRLYADGVEILSVDDSTYSSGGVGIWVYGGVGNVGYEPYFAAEWVDDLDWTLEASDNFTGSFNDPIAGRTPDTLGDVWGSNQGGSSFRIEIDQTADAPGGSPPTWIINTTPLADDQACEAIMGAGNAMGCGVRMDASGNGYVIYRRGNIYADLNLYRMDTGSLTSLGSLTQVPLLNGAAEVVRIEAIGSEIRLLINNTIFITATDSTYTSGYAGIIDYAGDTSRLDNFRAYDVVGGATPTLDQLSFRFRNDNGDEDSATWIAAQDTNISIAPDTNFRLRMLVNATGDPASKGVKLQYRKVGDSTWRDVNPE